jgi:hypothetical protein
VSVKDCPLELFFWLSITISRSTTALVVAPVIMLLHRAMSRGLFQFSLFGMMVVSVQII